MRGGATVAAGRFIRHYFLLKLPPVHDDFETMINLFKYLQRAILAIVIGQTVVLADHHEAGGVDLLGGGNLDTHWETTGNWSLVDGVATLTPRPGEKGWSRWSAYLWSKRQYGDFEIAFEYMVQERGNSGFYFRVGDRDDPVTKGIEVQIYDSASHPKDKPLNDHDSGGVIPGVPPTKRVAKAAGEWNKFHITVQNDKLTVNLNGEKVNEIDLAEGALASRPKSGYIGFQDHGLPFALRNIKVKSLGENAAATGHGHEVLMQGNGKLARVSADGKVAWEMQWGGIHDIHVLASGNILTHRGTEVAEIDPNTKEVVWSYDSKNSNGNAGKAIEVHAVQPLADGNVMIAESGAARIIEINREGKLLKEVKLKIDSPSAHSDTRLVRKLDTGHYLVCHENDQACREYDSDGNVVWDFDIPMFGKEPKGGHGPEGFGGRVFGAVRLKNGNTLIATGNGHSIIEVTPEKEIVWKIEQNDLPGITLAWVTTLEVLENGNYVIGNCHAGPKNPLLVEVDPKTKKVVWQFDRFDLFGNSAPNSILLDQLGKTLR